MIVVHHLENSRSQRILWLLEELALPYEVRRYERDPKTMLAPPELKRIHPLGKSPLIEIDGEVLAETGAIVEYLTERQRQLGPEPDAIDALRWRQFIHYAEGSMMPPLLAILVVGRLGLLGRPARKPLQAMLAVHLRWLESELAERDWFAGDAFSAADVMMSFPLEAARSVAGSTSAIPGCRPGSSASTRAPPTAPRCKRAAPMPSPEPVAAGPSRRRLLGGALATGVLSGVAPSFALAAAPGLAPIPGSAVPIAPAEREARIETLRGLMRAQGIAALLVEPGASLRYFTGIKWHRTERTTAAVIPARGAVVDGHAGVRGALGARDPAGPGRRPPLERARGARSTRIAQALRRTAAPPSGPLADRAHARATSSSTACAKPAAATRSSPATPSCAPCA